MAQRRGIFGRRRDRGEESFDPPVPSGAEAQYLKEEATRRIAEVSRQAERETVTPAEQLEDAKRGRDEATRTLHETLARLEDAERRATAAEQAASEAGRASRQDLHPVEAETDDLRGELQLFRNDTEPRAAAISATRAHAHPEGGGRERIARIEAETEEGLRAEVAVARKAAEDRFGEKLADRERELEVERERKVRLIEDSDRRLSQIEARAVEAAERVDAAERSLAEEVMHLRADAEAHVTAEAERARRETKEVADARISEREAELAESLAHSEQAKRDAEARVLETEGAVREAKAAAAARLAKAERGWEVERSTLAAELSAARERAEQAELRAAEAEPAEIMAAEARAAPTADDVDLDGGESEATLTRPEPEPVVEPAPGRIVYSRASPKPREVVVPEPMAASEAGGDAGDDRISLTRADVEQLREIGFSVTQAKRVIRYREERGLDSVVGLDEVPGFPRSLLDTLASRLRD